MTGRTEPNESAHEAEPWDRVISPSSAISPLPFHEIWKYRDLLFLLTKRDIIAFYKQTLLGPLWFFVQPILTSLIYVLVFGRIARLSTDGVPQLAFYLCGVTFWNYFAECFNKTATVFKDNAHVFGKVYFPRIIMPLSIVLSNLLRFLIQFLLLLCCVAWYWHLGHIRPNAYILCIPLLVAVMASLGLSFGMLFSSVTTKYRDMIFLLQFGVQLLMYATPVVYPSSEIPNAAAKALSWNPLGPIFEMARYGLLGAGEVSMASIAYTICFSAVATVVSALVFDQVQRTAMDTI